MKKSSDLALSKATNAMILWGLVAVFLLQIASLILMYSGAGLGPETLGLLGAIASPFIQIPMNLIAKPWRNEGLVSRASFFQLPSGIYALGVTIWFIYPRLTGS